MQKNAKGNKYQAKISIGNGKQRIIGSSYNTANQAAKAYDKDMWQPGTVRPTNDNGKFYSTSVSSKNNTKNVQHQENESGLPYASFKVLGRNSFSSNGNLGEPINYTIVPGLSLENDSYMRSFGVCYVHKYN